METRRSKKEVKHVEPQKKKSVPRKKQEEKQLEPTLSQESINILNTSKNQIIKQDTVDTCKKYEERYLTIVKIPEFALIPKKKSKLKQWCGNGGVVMGQPTCSNCPFYYSTGQSNEGKNFPEMWFPFLYIVEQNSFSKEDPQRGWIHKAYNLASSKEFTSKLTKEFSIVVTPFLKLFLEKFSHWWQISISAAMPSGPNSLWSHPELAALKLIALNYDFIQDINLNWKFVVNQQIIKVYNILGYQEKCEVKDSPEEVNKWLENNNALCKF